MRKYDTPKIETVLVDVTDVITTSGEDVLFDASSLNVFD